ncbi:MAG TPA: NADH-quinone oxidoreductase subunit J [Rhodanobacteraceae bacterium]|nr:NADH-quinone oxidoreductase subunit J [Rhodanobacteraceae bacterium]
MIAPVVEWIAFGVFAFIAVAGALGMTTTMSMFRSGIFLMASFIGVAGLFILLLADLIALLQVMMYIGGMLVMILFMLLFMHDPGGAMMSTHMSLKGPEKWFSLGLARRQTHGKHPHGQHEGDHGGHGDDMPMQDMSMYTAIKRPAAILALLTGALLIALLVWRPHWAVVHALPDQDSPTRIGELLMGKYMIAFEGAGLMILLGIFGAVLVQRPATPPPAPDRDQLKAAIDETPPPIEDDTLEPEVLDLREDEDR